MATGVVPTHVEIAGREGERGKRENGIETRRRFETACSFLSNSEVC